MRELEQVKAERDRLTAENRELTYANEQLCKHLEDRAKGLDPFTKMLRDELDTEYNKRKQAEAKVARLTARWAKLHSGLAKFPAHSTQLAILLMTALEREEAK